jgi:hypothetical protein
MAGISENNDAGRSYVYPDPEAAFELPGTLRLQLGQPTADDLAADFDRSVHMQPTQIRTMQGFEAEVDEKVHLVKQQLKSKEKEIFPTPKTRRQEVALELAALKILKKECQDYGYSVRGRLIWVRTEKLTEELSRLSVFGKVPPVMKWSHRHSPWGRKPRESSPHSGFLIGNEDPQLRSFADSFAGLNKSHIISIDDVKEGRVKPRARKRSGCDYIYRWSRTKVWEWKEKLGDDIYEGKSMKETIASVYAKRKISLRMKANKRRTYGLTQGKVEKQREERREEVCGENVKLPRLKNSKGTELERIIETARRESRVQSSSGPSRTSAWKRSAVHVMSHFNPARDWDTNVDPALQGL